MGINKITVENFTVFEDININFASGINVIIGDNGTGKTHLLKLMNMLVRPEFEFLSKAKIHDYFNVFKNCDVIRDLNDEKATVILNYNNIDICADIFNENNSVTLDKQENNETQWDNVFIPAKELLTHSKGFVSLYDERYIPFDKSYKDLLSKSLLPNLRNIPELGINILPKIEKIIGGKVLVEDDVFYIIKDNGSKIVFDLESEGIKKIALIWQLIMNGSIKKGSVLFWDEPEANINPKLIGDLAEILLELSQNDVQVFVTTHEYMFAKYIEVLTNEDDNVLFHSLYKTENDCVDFETEKKLSLLSNNSMSKENVILYKKEIARAMQ